MSPCSAGSHVVLWAELCHSATWQGRTGTARQMAEPPRQNVAELKTVGAVKDVLYSVRSKISVW